MKMSNFIIRVGDSLRVCGQMDQPTLLTLVAALLEHQLDSWLVPPGIPPASLGVKVDGVEDSAHPRAGAPKVSAVGGSRTRRGWTALHRLELRALGIPPPACDTLFCTRDISYLLASTSRFRRFRLCLSGCHPRCSCR